MEEIELKTINNVDELNQWIDLVNKEIYKLADALSLKRTRKPINKHERQTQLKIIKSAERIVYEN